MRGALTLNQSETDKSKPTNLKSVLTFSGQCCLRCVLTWLILHFPLRVYGCMLRTFCYPVTLVQDKAKNVEVRCSSRLMLSNKGFMHHWLCLTNDGFKIIMWYFAMDVSPTGIEYIDRFDTISHLHWHWPSHIIKIVRFIISVRQKGARRNGNHLV